MIEDDQRSGGRDLFAAQPHKTQVDDALKHGPSGIDPTDFGQVLVRKVRKVFGWQHSLKSLSFVVSEVSRSLNWHQAS